MIGAVQPAGQVTPDRRMRRRRIAKVVLVVITAIVWVPIAIVMAIASLSNGGR